MPRGQYQATVKEITEEEGPWGPYARFVFEIDDPEYNGISVTGAASARFSSRSKLYCWTRAILGGKVIPRDYTFDSTHLIGRHCVLVLEVMQDSDGGEFNRIRDITPVRRSKAAPPDLTDEPPPDEGGAMTDFPF